MLHKFVNSENGRIINKFLAIILVMTLTFSNYIFLGMYIGKGIISYAKEEKNEESLEISQKFITNKVYQVGENFRRIVQVKVSSKIQNAEGKAEFAIPKTVIEGKTAKSIKVVSYATEFISKNDKVNFTAKEENEFIITYVYDEECEYNEETKSFEVKQEPILKAEIISVTVKTEKEDLKAETEKIEYTKKAQFGDIIEINETISYLYKGNMYLRKDTEYSTNLKVEIKSIEEEIFEDFFILSSDEKVLKQKEDEETETEEIENAIYYKSTIFSKKELLNMFSNLDVKDKYIVVNSEANDEIKNTIILFGEYEEENYEDYTIIDLSKESQSDEVVVEYAEGTNKVNILSSIPVKEGCLNIKHNKLIKLDNTIKAEEIEKLESSCALIDYNLEEDEEGLFEVSITGEKEIKEPTTKATLNMEYLNSNQTMLSSLIDNEVRFTINLIANDVRYKLYENPTIEVTLPSAVKIASTNDIALTLEDGLKIKNTTISGNTITIELEGKQENYNYDEVQQSISIGAILTVNKATPSGDLEITTTCKNGEDEEINLEATKISVFSPKELMTLNTVTVGTNIANSIEENNLIKINTFEDETKAVVDTTLVNNCGKSISDLEIVGEITEKDSTFSSALEKEVVASGLEFEIKYFEGKNETIDIEKATSFVISIKEMKQGENLNIKYELNIPENLPYNESLYTTLNSSYKCEEKTESKTLKMQITTGKGPSAKIEILPEVKNNQLNGGQIVTYNIKVTNDGDEDINEETILKYEVLENAKIIDYTVLQAGIFEYSEDEDNIKQWKISKILVGETKEISVNVKLDNVKEELEAISKATVTVGDKTVAQKEVKEEVKPADFEIINTTITNNIIKFTSGDEANYRIEVKNISGKDLTNAVITTTIPKHTEFIDGYIYDEDTEEKGTNCKEEEGIITYNIDKISNNETVVANLNLEVLALEKELDNEGTIEFYSTVKADGTKGHQSNMLTSLVNTEDLNINIASPNKATLKEGDSIEYIITVTNKGKTGTTANIIDILPEIVSANQVIYYTSEDNKKTTDINNSQFDFKYPVGIGDTLTIIIKGSINNLNENEELRTINNVAKIDLGDGKYLESEVITNIIVQNEQTIKNNQSKDDKYTVSGIVWVDEDEDGTKKSTEKTVKDVEVILINASTGEFVKDSNGNVVKTKTSENGEYTFSNLANGTYKVIFKYDTAKYHTTDYKKEGIGNSVNSDASSQTVTINGEVQTIALTDTITIKDSSVVNIDLGLKENDKFDLSLKKEIKKVTVKNNSGTEEYEFTNTNFSKVEIPGKYFKGSTLLIEYEITVNNNGDVAANITDILDYMPKELSFNSEMNTNWYMDSEGSLHDIALSMDTLEAGKSITEKLILTTTLNSEEAITITNIAEIGAANNSQGLQEENSTPANKKDGEDDIGKAELIVSIKTGGAWLYIGIALISLIIIAGGIYIINKKVLRGSI